MGFGEREIYIYDQRSDDQSLNKLIILPPNASYKYLKDEIIRNFSCETDFVISTTNRDEINNDEVVSLLDDKDMLYLLHNLDQELVSQTKQQVQFLPHYDTLVKSGMYEYYNSEGQNPLPYAFAELIDNSLAATANNGGNRNIQLRVMVDDENPEKSLIFVIDNGRGMTSWQLNNWAIYRLSKFIRQDKSFKPQNDIPQSPTSPKKAVPRSLNSEISYFGVGGKQAIFFIGNGTRMITKPKDSLDVHELCISKEQFEKKEQQKEFVYSGEIRNRKLADSSHLSEDDAILKKIIEEEEGKENFTCVVISGIAPEHIAYLKEHYNTLCTQLAHIYHYYIHGPNGNDLSIDKDSGKMPLQLKNIDIEVHLVINNGETKIKNLRVISDDMQTKYIQSAHSSFEFKASVEGCKFVEGIIRYHPFLYDQETYPSDPFEKKMIPDDDNLNQADIYPARGRRAIFECFWNGRLIPYTPVRDFEWCMPSKKQRNQIPPECYNRISGVLWTNDDFQVSTNKLTFLDLENRMKDSSTVFHRIINGQEKRGLIEKQFNEWLMICHEKCDKQILFKDFQGHIARADQPKLRQFPWAVFNSIEWDGRLFTKGQRVRTQRTAPVVLGTIRRFYLYGEYDENDVYATGGDFEIQLEPLSMFSESKSFPLSKLDRKADDSTIRKALENEEDKLPHRLIVNWPEGDQLYANERRPAGKTIGAIKVEISNKRGELISKIPGTNKKLLIDLKLKWHSPKGDVLLSHFLSSHAKSWPYWFRKMENVKELGAYSLILQAVINDNETEIVGKVLPSYQLKFSVTEGPPEKFSIGLLEGPFKVGVPFNIPLEFHDRFGNTSKPAETFRPLLHAPGASLDFEGVVIKGNVLLVKTVTALALVESQTGKNFQLSVKVLGMEKESHTMKMRLLPGPPVVLMVKPESEMIEIENGAPISFDIVCVDASANVTIEPKLIVTCKFVCKNQKDLPSYKIDISSSGKGILTGPPLLLQNFNGNELVVAKIQAVNRPEIEVVQKKILVQPSRRASSLRITYINDEGNKTDMEPDSQVTWLAGELIKGLEFLVYDEGGRPIKITQSLASKLKVNWVSRGVKDLFMAGKLPDVATPTNVQQPMYCHVTLSEANVIDFGFTIKPIPGPEFAIKAYCESTSELRLGETLASNILIDVLDRHSNKVSKITSKSLSNLQIICDDLDVTSVEKYPGKKSSFLVKKIKFTDGKLGDKELLFKWNNLKDTLLLLIKEGHPAKIFYPNYNPKEYVSLRGDSFLPYPVIVQLSDAQDHPVKISGIKVQLGTDEALKINPVVHASKTNELGQVDFGEIKVALKKNQLLPKCPALECPNFCRGVYSLCAKAVYNKSNIIGPLLKLHIKADPSKPVSVKVEYEFKDRTFEVDKQFPDFAVTVISEDGSAIKNIKNTQLKMRINPVKLVKPSDTPTRVILCPPTDARESNSVFHFKRKHVPALVGTYTIDFAYTTNTVSLNSEEIQVTVVAGPARKMVAEQDPGLPAVSNTAKFASRCLIDQLKLHFEDAKGNETGRKLNGMLHVKVTSVEKVELPKMAGNVTSIEIPIAHGQCNLQNVMIEENSPGIDGKEYILRCTPKFTNAPNEVDVAPYDVRFIFCNDSNKQAQFSQMSKERDNLLSVIKTYQTLFDTSRQLLKELEEAASSAAVEENRIKAELKQVNMNATSLTSVDKVNQTIAKLTQNRSKLIRAPKRIFGMTPAPEEPGVLGKIGQLAYVVDEDVAKVLSWHMQSDIDCVVTHSMEKARELHKRMGGRMQLLPLDSIYIRNLPDWSRPLIHTKIRNYRPTGNPVYARDCLIFPKEPENCKLVFGMLLGDTIILDTLEEATHYREMIVKHMFCPTLLTRTGERIRSNGKFGGQQNKAPPIDKLRGLVFGEPPQNQFREIQQQIELLESLKIAVEKSIETRKELHEQQRQENSVIMVEKVKEYHSAQKKLKDIENKLLETSSVTKGAKRLSNGNKIAHSLKILENTPERVEDIDPILNGLGGLGLTRSQIMKLKSQALEVTPSSPSDSPPTRKKRKL